MLVAYKMSRIRGLEGVGIPEAYAQLLTDLETDQLGKRMEERLNGDVKLVMGKEPIRLATRGREQEGLAARRRVISF